MPSSNAATKKQYFKPSRAGRIATVVANTILNGVVPPKAIDGVDGDFYIDTKALLFYGPKKKSRWPSPTSIRGPQGQTGQSGSNGADARPSANVIAAGAQGLSGASGPKGEQGPQGIPGVAGPAGAQGESGATGAPGATGTPGASGAAGASGAPGPAGSSGPPGNAGPQGPPGSNGSNGSIGSVGPTGATGSVGANGATGPSSAQFGQITFVSAIQGIAGSTQSSSGFGSFEPGMSYVLRLLIQTFNVDRLISTYPLSMEISAQGAAPSITVSYLVANGSSFNLSTRRDDVSVTADVILDGALVSHAYTLSASVTCAVNTGSFPILLQGKYHAILVGQVTQTG